ncbi:hypothetical protein Rs2_42716 [Raphanus sativus]|nr:hypothetical protein Rs2_42716 [Raphanus sativus]
MREEKAPQREPCRIRCFRAPSPLQNPYLHSSPLYQSVAKSPQLCLVSSAASASSELLHPPPPVGDSVSGLERCLQIPFSGDPTPSSSSSISASSPSVQMCPVRIATGGGGGDIGKKINFGGGDGGDDDGDDDDGDEGGLFRRRMFLAEIFDRKFVDAVLNEWQKTMLDLPAGLRQAYEMVLVSSAQMVKGCLGPLLAGCWRILHFFWSKLRRFGGRSKTRKERIKEEWDLAPNKRSYSISMQRSRRALQGSLSNFLAGKKKNRVSVTVPSVTTNALGYGAFLGSTLLRHCSEDYECSVRGKDQDRYG